MPSSMPELPGMYYDEVKRKYFKVMPHHIAPKEAPYSEQNIRKEKRLALRANRKTEQQNSRSAERPIRRSFHRKTLSWNLFSRELQLAQSQRTTAELLATAYAKGLKCKLFHQIGTEDFSSSCLVGSFVYIPANRQWVAVNYHTCEFSWFSIEVEDPQWHVFDTRPSKFENEGLHAAKTVLWEDKLIVLVEGIFLIGNLTDIAPPPNPLNAASQIGISETDWSSSDFLNSETHTEYRLSNIKPALTDPEHPIRCISSSQSHGKKPFKAGDPSILAIGYGKRISLMYSDPSCQIEFTRGSGSLSRDPRHGIAEKSTIRVNSDVLSLECFPDSWLFACGLRNGDINVYDYRLPPDVRVRWLRHPSSVTGLRKLQGSTIIACGTQHSLCKYDVRFSHVPHKKKTTTPVLTYDHQNEYQLDLGFDADDECGIVAAATDQKTVRLFSLTTGEKLKSPVSTHEYEDLVRQISFVQDREDGAPRRLVLAHANHIWGFSYA